MHHMFEIPRALRGGGESVTTQKFSASDIAIYPISDGRVPASNSTTTPLLFPASVSGQRSQPGRLPTTHRRTSKSNTHNTNTNFNVVRP